MTKRIDKDSLPLNKPRRTPDHPTKSHVVKTKVDGAEKIIRFGEQGASTAGKPKAGESERMTAKRESFKARHASNIAKGPASAAYWANKVKWADGGSVRTNYAEGDSVSATPRKAALGKIADALKSAQEYTSQYEVSPWVPLLGGTGVDEMLSLPGAASLMDDVSYHGAGALLRGGNTVNTFKVDPRIVDVADVAGTVIPITGALTKLAKKGLKSAVKKAVADEVVTPKEQKMLQGFYRGYAGQNPDTAELFITPQKRVADFYAEKRSSQIGGTPHAEMILIEQLTGNPYGHSTLGTGANPPMMTMARKIKADDVKGRTQLYATGGAVKVINKLAKVLMGGSDEVALTAAQRAEAGRKAAELIKSQPQVKASEALGQLREKGVKRTTTTQADRTRVGGGNIGGASFPAISEADPAYADKVWGVMDEGTAARLKNLTDPETAWTTMLGSANQLKTNPIVFDKLKRQFLTSMKQGNLPPELEAKINHNLALTFGEGASIRDPNIWKQADTFEKRAALADLMMGQGIAPSKGGVALGGEKSGRGVIFRPTDTLIRETEPYLLHSEHGGDVPTFAAGPRLFRLDKESVNRPDLHPGFPTLITGEDYNVNMIPTPTGVYLPDWHAKFKRDNPERYPPFKTEKQAGPGYYDLALGVKGEGLPSQELNDAYIRHLIREGYAEGGPVGYGVGGAVSKGLAKLAKKVLQESSSEVLPAAKREANLQKFLAPSAEKRRMYHGSKKDITEFKTRKNLTDESNMTGHYADERDAVFLSPEPEFTNNFSVMGYTDLNEAPTTYPVYVQAKNPFDFDNSEHLKKVKQAYFNLYHDPKSDFYNPNLYDSERSLDLHTFNKRVDGLSKNENNWPVIENEKFQLALKNLGFDSFYTRERGTKNLGVYDPSTIKSAIGNRGTYDVSEPDINKAKGGSVNMAEGGLVGDPVMAYDPLQVEEIMNSIDAPRGYAEGGTVKKPFTYQDALAFRDSEIGSQIPRVERLLRSSNWNNLNSGLKKQYLQEIEGIVSDPVSYGFDQLKKDAAGYTVYQGLPGGGGTAKAEARDLKSNIDRYTSFLQSNNQPQEAIESITNQGFVQGQKQLKDSVKRMNDEPLLNRISDAALQVGLGAATAGLGLPGQVAANAALQLGQGSKPMDVLKNVARTGGSYFGRGLLSNAMSPGSLVAGSTPSFAPIQTFVPGTSIPVSTALNLGRTAYNVATSKDPAVDLARTAFKYGVRNLGPSNQVQYQTPFAEGGSVTAYDSDRVDAIVNQFM